jgi:hypothetical protein
LNKISLKAKRWRGDIFTRFVLSYHRCNTLQIEQYHRHLTKGCVLHLCSLAISLECVRRACNMFWCVHGSHFTGIKLSVSNAAAEKKWRRRRHRRLQSGTAPVQKETAQLCVVVLARSNGRAPLFISSSGERVVIRTLTGLLAAELISGPFLRLLTHCARVLFLVTQEMFSSQSQSPPPNRGKTTHRTD